MTTKDVVRKASVTVSARGNTIIQQATCSLWFSTAGIGAKTHPKF